jgi:hypothetical protein
MHLCTQDQVVFSTAILAAVAHGLYALSLLPQGEETRSQYQASGFNRFAGNFTVCLRMFKYGNGLLY